MDVSPPTPCEVLPICPMCNGPLELIYDRPEIKECECRDCGTRVSISAAAWNAARQLGTGKSDPTAGVDPSGAKQLVLPARLCPECQRVTLRHLPASSEGAKVDYYRCDDCGHVWSVRKSRPNLPPAPVTR